MTVNLKYCLNFTHIRHTIVKPSLLYVTEIKLQFPIIITGDIKRLRLNFELYFLS